MFKTLADVRRANKGAGHYFFERGTMNFFGSRIESGLYVGQYFVTSEEGFYKSDPRRYTIRMARPDGSVYDASDFRQFASIEDAREEARALARLIRAWPPSLPASR